MTTRGLIDELLEIQHEHKCEISIAETYISISLKFKSVDFFYDRKSNWRERLEKLKNYINEEV